MQLSVADRIYLLNLDTLPTSGSFLTMRVLNEFISHLRFTAEEIEKWELKEVEGRITWNTEKIRNIDVTVSETLIEVVTGAIEKSENVQGAAVSTFEKFFEFKEMFAKAKKIGEEKKDEGKATS